jgi:hypothetical protein
MVARFTGTRHRTRTKCGGIRNKWEQLGWEAGFIGYPLTDEEPTPDGIGRFNHFQGATIYWHPAIGAHEVHGAIQGRWGQLGWEQGILGFPTSDEHDSEHGHARVSEFQNGAIYWDPNRGAYEVFRRRLRPSQPSCRRRWDIRRSIRVVGVHAAVLLTKYFSPPWIRANAPKSPMAGDSVVMDVNTGARPSRP